MQWKGGWYITIQVWLSDQVFEEIMDNWQKNRNLVLKNVWDSLRICTWTSWMGMCMEAPDQNCRRCPPTKVVEIIHRTDICNITSGQPVKVVFKRQNFFLLNCMYCVYVNFSNKEVLKCSVYFGGNWRLKTSVLIQL